LTLVVCQKTPLAHADYENQNPNVPRAQSCAHLKGNTTLLKNKLPVHNYLILVQWALVSFTQDELDCLGIPCICFLVNDPGFITRHLSSSASRLTRPLALRRTAPSHGKVSIAISSSPADRVLASGLLDACRTPFQVPSGETGHHDERDSLANPLICTRLTTTAWSPARPTPVGPTGTELRGACEFMSRPSIITPRCTAHHVELWFRSLVGLMASR
jgi:hypothetical protein